MTALQPDIVDRPKLAHWLFERDMTQRAAADLFGCSNGTVTNMCRPFGDPLRRVPKPALMARIVLQTGGAITAETFYPPELRSRTPFAGSPETQEAGS